jgi:ferric-dicitrate binding protein FerR (iron transport regulator)
MKRLHLIIYILLFVATFSQAQKVSTPLPHREGLGGESPLTLDFQKASLAQALDTLRTYTNDYNITFVHNDIEHLQVTLQAQVRSVPEAVELICKSQPVKVKVKDGNIIVKY